MKTWIPLEECKDGWLYEIEARNNTIGIFDAAQKGFVISRMKIGFNYLFTEYHWDHQENFGDRELKGTASPIKEIEKAPEFLFDQEKLDWLNEKGRESSVLIKNIKSLIYSFTRTYAFVGRSHWFSKAEQLLKEKEARMGGGLRRTLHDFSVFGNPEHLTPENGRDYACDKYRDVYFPKLKEIYPKEIEQLVELGQAGNLVLVCFCAPLRCHAETIRSHILEQIRCR